MLEMFYSNLIVQENENKDVEFPQITLLISDKAGVVNTWFYRLNLLIFFFFHLPNKPFACSW